MLYIIETYNLAKENDYLRKTMRFFPIRSHQRGAWLGRAGGH